MLLQDLPVQLSLLGDPAVRRVRVEHDREAVPSRPGHRLRRRRSEPYRRMRFLRRLRQHFDVLTLEVLPLEGELLLGPGADHRLHVFPEDRIAVARVDTESLELPFRKTAADPPVDPAAGKHVEQRHLLRQAQRVVKGRQRHTRADPQVLRASGYLDPHHVDRRTDAEGTEVVLRQPHRVVPVLIHDVDALERPPVDLFQRDPAVRPREELEHRGLHGRATFSQIGGQRRTSRAPDAVGRSLSRAAP